MIQKIKNNIDKTEKIVYNKNRKGRPQTVMPLNIGFLKITAIFWTIGRLFCFYIKSYKYKNYKNRYS